MTYQHTQHAPLGWMLVAIAVLTAAAGALADIRLLILACLLGALLLLLTLCFGTLTVVDEVDSIRLQYGPMPLLGRRVRCDPIASARASRSSVIDGWGIHSIPGRGWTYNLWGRECVELTVNGRTLRIGSDDAENLAAFIRSRI